MLFFSYLITITKVQQLFIIANTITNDTKDAQTFPYSWVLRYHIIRHHKDNSFLNILVYIHFMNYFHLWASQLWWWKGNASFYFQKSSHSFLFIFCHIVYNVQCDTMTWIIFFIFHCNLMRGYDCVSFIFVVSQLPHKTMYSVVSNNCNIRRWLCPFFDMKMKIIKSNLL